MHCLRPSRSLPFLFWSSCAVPAVASEVAAPDSISAEDYGRGNAVSRLATAGAFLAWTEHARTDTHRATGSLHSGHMTQAGWSHSGRGELVLRGPGSAANVDLKDDAELDSIGVAVRGRMSSRYGEPARGELGLKTQLAFERRAGFDLTLTVSYENEGFNLRPAIASELLGATHLGSFLILANLGYGHGLADDERYGTLKLAAVTRLSEQLHAGLDSMLDMDLELDDDEPDGEPQVLLQAGPALTWTLGNVALSAQGGLSVLQPRFERPRAGGVAVIGAGGAF